MLLTLVVLAGLSVAELAVFLPGLWRLRRWWAAALVLLLAAASGVLFAQRPSLTTFLLATANLYRIVNLLRLVEDRLQEVYLRRTALRSSALLIVSQLGTGALWWAADAVRLTAYDWWFGLAAGQLLLGVLLLVWTARQLRTTTPPMITEHYADRDLPSISICIPARNETDTLAVCLRALIASNYPKLEILVLDDCSQDETSDVIRSFAHDGVRFVKGVPATEKWLAKNWAYQQLYEAASGTLLIFAGVDIRFEPGSIRQIVTTLLQKHKRMMSLMSRNAVMDAAGRPVSILMQPVRYGWELCLPRRRLQRPPVLSSCWVVERSLLKSNGSFASVAHAITPESHLARLAAADGDAYSFIRSDDQLAVTSLKSWPDQWETAVRTRYPQLHRRPELVMLVSLLELTGLLAPYALCLIALGRGEWSLAVVSGGAAICVSRLYHTIVAVTYQRFIWKSWLLAPLAVALDIALRHVSMWQYEFSEVLWKGRNVCLPVLRVLPMADFKRKV